jgi:hypothetical protein
LQGRGSRYVILSTTLLGICANTKRNHAPRIALVIAAVAIALTIGAQPQSVISGNLAELAVGVRAQLAAPFEQVPTERPHTETTKIECGQGQPQIVGGTDFCFEVLGLSAVVSALHQRIFVSWGLIEFRHWWSAKNTVYFVTLTRGVSAERYKQLGPILSGFYCLVVRYGTDNYLSTLASDQEKFEGRLKNKIIRIETKLDGAENANLVLKLPVHKRIGTQFKVFCGREGHEYPTCIGGIPERVRPYSWDLGFK